MSAGTPSEVASTRLCEPPHRHELRLHKLSQKERALAHPQLIGPVDTASSSTTCGLDVRALGSMVRFLLTS